MNGRLARAAAGRIGRWFVCGRALSIRTQLIAIVALGLAPVALVMLQSAHAHRMLLVQQAGEQVATTARLQAVRQDHLVNEATVLLHGLRQTDPVKEGDAVACQVALTRVVADVPILNGIGVSNANGDKFCNTNATSPVNLADRPFFRAALEGRLAVGPMVVARTNGRAILPVALPVLDAGGRPWRVLTTGISIDAIAEQVRQATLPAGAALTIADADGVVLASTLPSLPFGVDMPWRGVERHGPGTVTWDDQLLGIAHAHGGDLIVVVSQPRSVLLAASDRIFLRESTVFGGVMLLAALLAAAVAELALARRLHSLAAVAARLADGELTARANLPGGGDEIGRLAHAVDHMAGSIERHVADLAAREAAARHDAMHDPLTGLPNRALLRERLAEVLLRCRRYGERAAVLCIDLDRFKEVNDSLGHSVGDSMLLACAERLKVCARETDTVARLGGDEFAVLQTDVGAPGDVQVLCERIQAVLGEPFQLDGHEVVVGASIGVALIPADGEDASRLMQNADIALYRAKGDGRGRTCFFEAGMDQQLRRRKALEADLRAAVGTAQLELHYQPQLDAGSGAIVGCEALLRWRHPERGMIPPAEFVPVAEETGLISPLGEWVLRTACADAAGWPGIKVSINVSPVQFKQRGLAQRVEQALIETGLPAHRLEIEITEGVLMQNTADALKTLEQLKALGVQIAMDDFGTGYSSLSYLQKFPFDKLKIDKSFIAGLARGEQNGAIVRAVVSLGHSLGIRTCAEGVETPEQLDLLRDEGCDEVQGFLFGHPAPAATVEAMLRRRPPLAEAVPIARVTAPIGAKLTILAQ